MSLRQTPLDILLSDLQSRDNPILKGRRILKRGDYDYNHASSGHQFTAIVILIAIALLGGLTLGLTLLTSIL